MQWERTLRAVSAVGLSVGLTASCGGQDASDDEATAGSGARPLVDSDVTGVVDGAWVAGGAQWNTDDATWVVNRSAVQVSPAGEVLRTMDVPLGAGEFLFDNTVVEPSGASPHLVGIVCPFAADDPDGLGCGADVRTLVLDLASGKERGIGLPPYDPVVGAGLARALGTAGNEIIIQRAEKPGPLPGTVSLGIYAVTPSTGAVRALPLPDAILTRTSVCLAGDELVVLDPRLDADFYIESVEVLGLSVSTPIEWKPKATLDLSGRKIQTGGLACSGASAVSWMSSADVLTITQRDPVTFDQLGSELSFPATAGVDHVAFEPTDGTPVVTVKNMRTNRSTYLGPESPGAWTAFGQPDQPSEMGSAGVWVAAEVFDAIDLKQLATTEGLAAAPTPLPSETYVWGTPLAAPATRCRCWSVLLRRASASRANGGGSPG
jgi:hypothetical protein